MSRRNQFFRYFVSAGLYTQGGLFKTFDTGYDFNFDFKRTITAQTLISRYQNRQSFPEYWWPREDKNTPISAEDQNQLFRHCTSDSSGAGIVDGGGVKPTPTLSQIPGQTAQPYYGRGIITG